MNIFLLTLYQHLAPFATQDALINGLSVNDVLRKYVNKGVCLTPAYGDRYEAYQIYIDFHHNSLQLHYSDVIMSAMAFQITGVSIVQVQIKENVKAACHWPIWGESTVDRWFILTKDQ